MAEKAFGELSKAARHVKSMRTIAEKAVERMRPAPTYGTVVTIDRPNRKCTVRFGDVTTDAVPISMASVQPSRPGQVVRIEGTLGDRYVADVLGESMTAGGIPVGMIFQWPGTVIPSWAMEADGRLIDTDIYVALFGELQYRHGGGGSQFALPAVANSSPNVKWLIRVI